MQHRAVGAAAADGGVGLLAQAADVVAVVVEGGLHLVLEHARADLRAPATRMAGTVAHAARVGAARRFGG